MSTLEMSGNRMMLMSYKLRCRLLETAIHYGDGDEHSENQSINGDMQAIVEKAVNGNAAESGQCP